MEIDPTEISQGKNDYQEVDQTEIHPAETSKGENHDEEVIQRLTLRKIREGAKKAKSLSSACIYRVPNELRKLKKNAYTPRLIAIGPLHRNDPHLQTPMQHVKKMYMNNLLCRRTEGMENQEEEQEKILQECAAEMEKVIEDAKKCYAEEVKLDVEMMLVDGCFILEFLYRIFLGPKGADPIFAKVSTRITVQQDLLLLENQIPFLVLEKLFDLTLARIPNLLHNLTRSELERLARRRRIPNLLEKKNLSLTDYVFLPMVDRLMRPRPAEGNFTDSTGTAKASCWPPAECILWVSGNKMNDSTPEEKAPTKQKVSSGDHILHKLHDYYLPHHQKGKRESHDEELPSASELVYAGVKFIRTGDDLFKVKFTEPKGPLWWYHRARFEIPFLLIEDSTESVLRNLIAFEQCCPGTSQHFTSYAMLMDMLVNYDKDVQVLEKAGVLRNCLGAAKDVTELFNNLSKEVSYGEFFFADTCNRAIRYRKHFWPKNMAHVRRQYFASPWKFIAFCLGILYFCMIVAKFIRSFLT